MKLGVAGLLADGSAEAVAQIRELGFQAAAWQLPDLTTAQDEARLLDLRDALEAEDLELCQLRPPEAPNLIHPEPAMQEAGKSALAETLRAAAVLAAGSVLVPPGSLSITDPWAPHPENHSPAARERLIDSLRTLVPYAEETGIPLVLANHVLSPLSTPEAMRDVLDRVGSPFLRCGADPVHFIGTLDQAYDNTSLIDTLFDTLCDQVLTAHIRDVTVEDRSVLHIAECVPGQGYLDYETFLRRFDACCPNGVALIEPLPTERVPEARRAILEFADRAGLVFQRH